MQLCLQTPAQQLHVLAGPGFCPTCCDGSLGMQPRPWRPFPNQEAQTLLAVLSQSRRGLGHPSATEFSHTDTMTVASVEGKLVSTQGSSEGHQAITDEATSGMVAATRVASQAGASSTAVQPLAPTSTAAPPAAPHHRSPRKGSLHGLLREPGPVEAMRHVASNVGLLQHHQPPGRGPRERHTGRNPGSSGDRGARGDATALLGSRGTSRWWARGIAAVSRHDLSSHDGAGPILHANPQPCPDDTPAVTRPGQWWCTRSGTDGGMGGTSTPEAHAPASVVVPTTAAAETPSPPLQLQELLPLPAIAPSTCAVGGRPSQEQRSSLVARGGSGHGVSTCATRGNHWGGTRMCGVAPACLPSSRASRAHPALRCLLVAIAWLWVTAQLACLSAVFVTCPEKQVRTGFTPSQVTLRRWVGPHVLSVIGTVGDVVVASPQQLCSTAAAIGWMVLALTSWCCVGVVYRLVHNTHTRVAPHILEWTLTGPLLVGSMLLSIGACRWSHSLPAMISDFVPGAVVLCHISRVEPS